jgi:imidazolonepropionase-like amidohydrolase
MDNRPVFLHNFQLIDGTGREAPTERFAMLISSNRIESLAPQEKYPPPPNAATYDLQGMTMLPGLIDCHDHLANLEGSMVQRSAVPPSLAVFRAGEAFRKTLMAGFTSIRDASGVDLGMKLAVEQGLIPGPRLKISVVILSQLGGHNDHTEPAGIDSQFPWLQSIPSGICDGVEACRRKVREVVRAGADWIKIATTGGVGTPVGGPLIRQFSAEEVQMIVNTAHAAGKPVMSHAYGGEGVKICLDAGVDSIEHGAVLDDSLIEQMLKQGTWLVPTFTVLRRIIAIGSQDPSPLPGYMLPKALKLLESQTESFQKAYKAGVKMAMGTDLGGFGHGQNAGELAYLVEAGLTPMQAIVMSSQMGARCMAIDDQVGILKEGMLADLLVVSDNPLDDISILQNQYAIKLVMKDGVIFKNTLKETADE